MASLRRCNKCGSFVTSDRCPSCGGTLFRATKLGILATALGSSAFAMTLMACYGCPDCTYDYDDGGDRDANSNTNPGRDVKVIPVEAGGDASEPTPDAGKDAGDSGPSDAGADADAG